MLVTWWKSDEFKGESETMKRKHLLALENTNLELIPTEQSNPTLKRTRSSVSPVKAIEDSDGIYYLEGNQDSPIEDPVSILVLVRILEATLEVNDEIRGHIGSIYIDLVSCSACKEEYVCNVYVHIEGWEFCNAGLLVQGLPLPVLMHLIIISIMDAKFQISTEIFGGPVRTLPRAYSSVVMGNNSLVLSYTTFIISPCCSTSLQNVC